MVLKDQEGLPSKLWLHCAPDCHSPACRGRDTPDTGWLEGAEVCHESPKVGCASSACPRQLQLGTMYNRFSVFLPQVKTLPASAGVRHILQGVGTHILQGVAIHTSAGHLQCSAPLCTPCLATARTPVSLPLCIWRRRDVQDPKPAVFEWTMLPTFLLLDAVPFGLVSELVEQKGKSLQIQWFWWQIPDLRQILLQRSLESKI